MASKNEPKHWWLIAFTVITFGVAAMLSANALNDQWRYQEVARRQANNHAQMANDRIRNVCSSRPRPEGADCLYEARKAARENQRAEYELNAQRTSALWTAVMGWMSALAVALSAIGVYLIYRTFRQTQDQAAEIEKSVREAARSATAMEGVAESMATNASKIIESVDHQKTFGKMQMRAYVSVLIGKGRYQDDHHIFDARPRLLNTGHTPAKNVRWRIAMDILPNPLPDGFRFPMPKDVRGGMELPPQQDGYIQAIHNTRLDAEQAEQVKWGFTISCYVWGIVWYCDAFGDRHHTSFAQRIWWEPEPGTDGQIGWRLEGQHLQRHNRST